MRNAGIVLLIMAPVCALVGLFWWSSAMSASLSRELTSTDTVQWVGALAVAGVCLVVGGVLLLASRRR